MRRIVALLVALTLVFAAGSMLAVYGGADPGPAPNSHDGIPDGPGWEDGDPPGPYGPGLDSGTGFAVQMA